MSNLLLVPKGGSHTKSPSESPWLQRSGNLFLFWICLGSGCVLAGRVLVRFVPWEVIIPMLTRFSEDRVIAEKPRIHTELGDTVGFLMWIAMTAVSLRFVDRVVDLSQQASSSKTSLARLANGTNLLIFVVYINFSTVHPWRVDAFGDNLFIGFGSGVALLGVAVAMMLGTTSVIRSAGRWKLLAKSRYTTTSAWLIVAMFVLPQVLLQHDRPDLIRHDLIYLNEMAASVVGLTPLQSFFPTYSNLLGYPLNIATLLSTYDNPPLIWLSIYWGFLGILCWILAIELVHEQFGGKRVWAATATVLGLSITASAANPAPAFPSSAANLRVVLSLISMMLFVKVFKSRPIAYWKFVLLGLLLGITAINNVEFGLTAVIALLCTALVLAYFGVMSRMEFGTIVGATGITFLGLLLVLGDGLTHTIERYLVWATSRSSGGFIEAVPILGVHNVALACHALSVFVGWHTLQTTTELTGRRARGALGLASGLWGILTWPYFLGGPTPSFGGILWLPLLMSTTSLIGQLSALNHGRVEPSSSETSCLTASTTTGLSKVLAIFAVCAATALPNVQISIGKWLAGEFQVDRTSSIRNDQVVLEVERRIEERGGTDNIGYYGEFANLIEILLGIESVYGVQDPMIAYSSRETVDSMCEALEKRRPPTVLVSARYLPEVFKDSSNMNGPCPGMTRLVSGDESLLITYQYSVNNAP